MDKALTDILSVDMTEMQKTQSEKTQHVRNFALSTELQPHGMGGRGITY